MGLCDLPGPVLTWLDAWFATTLPATGRLVLWSVIAGGLTMALYGWLSPQQRLGETKRRLAESKAALDDFDGAFQHAFPLMRTMLAHALRQVGLVIGPAVVAMAPVLCLIAWLSTTYGYSFPERLADIRARAFPQAFSVNLHPAPASPAALHPRLLLIDRSGRIVHEQVLVAPVTTLHKRQWWNAFIGNPAGYLPDTLGVERIDIDLPRQPYLPFGPTWLRGWEAVFSIGLFITALAIKLSCRIH
jgi:hypothetical protein